MSTKIVCDRCENVIRDSERRASLVETVVLPPDVVEGKRHDLCASCYDQIASMIVPPIPLPLPPRSPPPKSPPVNHSALGMRAQ